MNSLAKSILLTVVASAITVFSVMAEETTKVCTPCQIKQSIRDAIAQSIKDAQMAKLIAGARQAELDEYFIIEDEYVLEEEIAEIMEEIEEMRARREECADPCNPCGPVANGDRSTNVVQQLCALQCCCEKVAHRLAKLAKDEKRCCKKLTHKIDHVEHLVESVIDETTTCCSVTEGLLVSIIDQEAVCCSVIESVLGDPATSVLDIPTCDDIDITSLVDSTSTDLMTWVKSLYVLLYNLYSCTCC